MKTKKFAVLLVSCVVMGATYLYGHPTNSWTYYFPVEIKVTENSVQNGAIVPESFDTGDVVKLFTSNPAKLWIQVTVSNMTVQAEALWVIENSGSQEWQVGYVYTVYQVASGVSADGKKAATIRISEFLVSDFDRDEDEDWLAFYEEGKLQVNKDASTNVSGKLTGVCGGSYNTDPGTCSIQFSGKIPPR
jgi:hypothetical protein